MIGALLTIVGALLFFLAGYFGMRLRYPAADTGAAGALGLEGEVQRLRGELVAAKKGASGPELQKELDALRGRVQAAEKRESELSQKVKAAEKARDASADGAKHLENEIAALKKEAARLEVALEERDNEPTQVTAPADGAAAAQLDLLKSETKKAKDAAAAQQKKLATLQKQLDAAKTAAKAAEARANDAEKRSKGAAGRTMGPAAGVKAPDAELLRVTRELELAKDRVKKAESVAADTKKMAEAQRNELADYRRQIDELEEAHNKPSTKVGVKDPEKLYRDAQAELQVARAELERSRLMIEQLKNEISDLKDEEPTQVRRDVTLVDDEKDTLQAKLSEAIDNLKRREDQVARLQSESTELARQLDEQESLKTVAVDSKAALAAADGKLAQLDRLEQQVYDLKDENKQLNDKILDLKALEALEQEHEALKLEKAALLRKGEEADKLRERQAEINQKLQSTEQERELLQDKLEEVQKAQDDRTDLALKVNVLQEQLRELERVREENLRLKSAGDEVASLQKQLEELRVENDNFRSLKLARANPPQFGDLPQDGGEEGMGNVLQRVVNQLAEQQGAQCAVFADELGLVVAGFGEHIDAMAAMSALFSEVSGRVRGVLPLGSLRQLALVDDNSLTFVAQPLAAGDSDLMLAMLAPGGAPDPNAVGELLSSVSAKVSEG